MKYYLKYVINETGFGVPIDEVKEIARPKIIRKLSSKSRRYIGFFELRKQKVVLFDLPGFLDFQSTKEKFEVIITKIRNIVVGLKVDRVTGIISAEKLDPLPDLCKPKNFMQGVIAENNSLTQVLSFAKIFSGARLRSLKNILKSK